MAVVNTDNNSGVEVTLPNTTFDHNHNQNNDNGNNHDAEADDAESSSYEEDGGGSLFWRFWDSINQMTVAVVLCLFILLGLTASLISTAAKSNVVDNMSSISKTGKVPTAAKSTKTKTPSTAKAGKVRVEGCGESFTDQKVVLSQDLDCGGGEGDPQQPCAVTLFGPKAEINCDDHMISQVASRPKEYQDGPFDYGICLARGAKATKCNVQQFNDGILVLDGGEIEKSVLNSNKFGIGAIFGVYSTEDATLTIENTEASNNVRNGLNIFVKNGVEAKLKVKGQVKLNSNTGAGINAGEINTGLDFAVETGSTLESCGNIGYDIVGLVQASSTATFSGTGYTCDQTEVVFFGDGIVELEPVCQACRAP